MWEGEEDLSSVPEQLRGQYQDQLPRFLACAEDAVSNELRHKKLSLTVRDLSPDGWRQSARRS